MSYAELRQNLSTKCILIKGFNREVDLSSLRRAVPEAIRYELVPRTTSSSDPNGKEWLVMLKNGFDAQRYVNDVRLQKCDEGILSFNYCQQLDDIPEKWLKENADDQPPPYTSQFPQGMPGGPQGHYYPGSYPHQQQHADPQGQFNYNMQYPGQQGMFPPQGYGPWNMMGQQGNENQNQPQNQPYWGYHQYYPQQGYPHGFPPGMDPNQPGGTGFPGQGSGFPVQGPSFSQPPSGSGDQATTTTSQPEPQSSTNQNKDLGHTDDDVTNESEGEETTTNMLKVTKLPSNTSEDALSCFFENTRKSGGGEVENVEIDEETNSAIITFVDNEAVDIVLNKMPIMFNKKAIEVSAYYPKEDNSCSSDEEEVTKSDGPCCTIEVKGMKETTTQSTIELYFESRRGADADIEAIEYVEDVDMYLITYENEDAVDTVMNKGSHKVDGNTLEVSRHVPQRGSAKKGSRKKLDEAPCCSIEVRGMKEGTSQDTIMYYFEGRKGANDDVKDIEYIEDEEMYLITFEDEKAVDTVMNKGSHKVDGYTLDVSRHVLQKRSAKKGSRKEPDEVPCCSIEVRGMKKGTSQDTIMYYFEGRKGADDDVKDIQYVEDKEMYIITFENEKAVETVIGKSSHVVDGTELQVKKHIPPKSYPNKVLVKGLMPSITKDTLLNYLEARTRTDVEGIDYGGEDQSMAIVTFTEPVEIEKIKSACQKKPLGDSVMTFDPVHLTNCIVVRGYSDDTRELDLEMYFDNKKRSGVDGVASINMNEDEDYCVIYFEEAEDALKVCEKTHTVKKCQLKIQVFYDCLGVPTDSEGPKFKPLPSLVLKDVDKYIAGFLVHSNTSKEALQKQLSKLHCKMNWPHAKNKNITAECTLTKDVPKCRKLAKTWKDDVKNEFSSFLKSLRVKKFSTTQEAWEDVTGKLDQITATMGNPEGVHIIFEKPPECEIVIVGYEIPVQDLAQRVQEVITEVNEDLDRQKRIVHAVVTLKHHELLILSYSHFQDKVRQKFDKMEVKLDLKKLSVKFAGLSKNVDAAKVLMYENLSKIAAAQIGMKSAGFIRFLKKKEVKAIISSEIKKTGSIGVWDIDNTTITMYSLSDDEAVVGANILKSNIIESTVNVDNFQLSILQTAKWKQFVDDLKGEYNQQSIVVDIETSRQGTIDVFCTSAGVVGVVREKVSDFFFNNTEISKTVDLPVDELKFLQEQMTSELNDLQRDFKQRHVTLVVKTDCIVIKGSPQGVKDAEDEVEKIVSSIYKTKHSLDKPGLKDLVESFDGKSQLKKVNQQARVVVSLAKDGGSRNRSSANLGAGLTFTVAGGQKVIVMKVDITTVDVDVIVNAANEDLVHSGGLAKAIITKGGSSIQDECNQYTKSHGKLAIGKCFCSGPGNLKCQMIVHAVGPVWKGGSGREEDGLCCCVEEALDEAERSGHNSIAIPALCTGIFGYPADKATSVIVRTVRDYFQSNPSSCIDTVYLCDVNPKAVTGFEKAANKFMSDVTAASRSGQSRNTGSGAQHGPITEGNIKIKIIKGELSKMKVDVLVNTTSKDLSLKNGAVSATLLKGAGNAIQDECTKSYPKGVQYGEVALTSGYNLSCQYVCHTCLDSWKPGGSAIQTLEKFVQECLSTAEKKKCQSIAFPALGTGKLGYPKDEVAKHMYMAVRQYAKQNLKSTVNEVLFVLYDKDFGTVKAFEGEESRLHGLDREQTGLKTQFTGRKSGKGKLKKQDSTGKKHKEGVTKGATGGVTQEGSGRGTEDNNEYSVDLGHLVFKVYQGDITKIKVDAIVNGTNVDLDLTRGAVSKAILSLGGKELETQLAKEKDEMKKNGMAVTTHKTGLVCKHVIHVNMEGADAAKVKDKVMMSLNKAEELKMQTVAFPALGTSTASNIPVSQTAEEMFRVVEKINTDKPAHLKEIHVVIFQKDMMTNFMGAIQACVKNQKGSSYLEKFFGWTGLVGKASLASKSIKVSRKDRQLTNAQAPVVNIQSNRVDFTIYALDKKSADKAIDLLDKMVQDSYIDRAVNAKIITEFQNDQVKEIEKKLTDGGKVEVTINTKTGEIKIKGLMRFVSDAVNEAYEIIREAEKVKQLGQKAKLVTDMVQWYYIENDNGKDNLKEYPEEVNLILESALKDQQKSASFLDTNGSKYIVDLDDYVEFPADDPTDKVQVLRKLKLVDRTFVPPNTWDSMDEAENLKIVKLKPTDKEFIDVTQKFMATSGGAKVDFVSIERVQNKTLYQQFIAKKKLMDDTNPKTVQNERELWHGFAEDAQKSICTYGFNRSYCGKNATYYGAGVYFAVNVAYSLQDTYSRVDSQGQKRMFLCRVLTGEYTIGNQHMRVPPAKPSAAGSHILYDTVTNDINNPAMFVIFHDSQAYPEYMIIFKRKT